MGYIALVIILFVAVLFLIEHTSFEIIFFWVLFSVIAIFPALYNTYELESIKSHEIEILALKDSMNTEGDFFLGTGKVKDVDYYYYMVESEKGIEMKKEKTSSSYIKETDGDEYKVEVFELKPSSKFIKWFYGSLAAKEEEYVFHIPENSIDKTFEVNME